MALAVKRPAKEMSGLASGILLRLGSKAWGERTREKQRPREGEGRGGEGEESKAKLAPGKYLLY
jgi:hypothetical protein